MNAKRSKKKLDKVDIEILQDDKKSCDALADSIVANKRLAAAIVHKWLKKTDQLLVPSPKSKWRKYAPHF